VLARRLLLFASLVLIAAAFSSALTTPPVREDERTTPTTPIRGVAAIPGSERIRAELPAKDPIVVDLGAVVELDVSAEEPDRVELVDLAIDAPVAPGTPATLVVTTDRIGTFPITLRLSGEQVGTLEVRAP